YWKVLYFIIIITLLKNRAMKKLKLTEEVIEKGHFSNFEDEETPMSSELQEMIKYGLKDILIQDKETESILTEEEIDLILNQKEPIQQETKHLKVSKETKNEQPENFYIY